MATDFPLDDSEARDAWLAEKLGGGFLGRPQRGPRLGGRTAALERLKNYDLADYGSRRNHLGAPVSHFAADLRHGFLNSVEVRDHLRTRYSSEPARLEEFLRQLAWRDFFEKCLAWFGDALQGDLEEPKHGVQRSNALPPDVAEGGTGLPCIDGMLAELFDDGYLHNHERLWFAAYLCHFRGVDWKAGAKLFRQYLYDGDWASNSASWQWVESTFSSKPYFMNKDNIATFSSNRWCRDCTAKCPFDASYEQLQHRLFAGNRAPLGMLKAASTKTEPGRGPSFSPSIPAGASHSKLVWLHDAALSFDDPALKSNPDAAIAFVFDRGEPWAFQRLAFLGDGVADAYRIAPNPLKLVAAGAPADELLRLARALNCGELHVSEHPNPGVQRVIETLKSELKVVVHRRPTLTDYADEPKRFTRYWDKVAPQVLGYRPSKKGKFHK